MSRSAPTLLLFLLVAIGLRADDRFLVAARVNGKSAIFHVDTGATFSHLYLSAARRFGLTNLLSVGTTEACDVAIGTNRCRMWFGVFETPPLIKPGDDGTLGWCVWRSNVFRLDAETRVMEPMVAVPAEVQSWMKFPLRADFTALALEVGLSNHPVALLLDTGSMGGVELPSSDWRQWRDGHPEAPATLHDIWGAWATNFILTEQCWADAIDVGSLHLTGVPVEEADAEIFVRVNKGAFAMLGMAALRRFDVIIDGAHGAAYLRPKSTPAPAFNHNRTGLAFIPPASPSDPLVARVLEGGPAYKAGIRNGDVLVSYNLPQFGSPPGTHTSVTVTRGSNRIIATILNQDLIGPPYDPAHPFRAVTNDFARAMVPLVLNPYDTDYYVDHANPCMRGAFYHQAIADWTAAIKSLPRDGVPSARKAGIFDDRGVCYLETGQFDKAIADFTMELALSPGNYRAVRNLGSAYSGLGQYDKEISNLTDYLLLNPTNQDARIMRGYSYLYSGDFTNAIVDFETILQAQPTNAWAQYYMGCAFADKGDYKEAVEWERRALSRHRLPFDTLLDVERRLSEFEDKVH